MNEKLKNFFRSLARKMVRRVLSRKMVQRGGFGGRFFVEHYRAGKLIGSYDLQNALTNEGLDLILNVWGHGTSPIGTWYIGLIDGAGAQSLANGDTMASHAGWSELTAYDEATRPAFVEGAASSQSISNTGNEATFTLSATNTLHGVFFCSDNVKGASDGVLHCTAPFAAEPPVVDDDVMKIRYTLTASRV